MRQPSSAVSLRDSFVTASLRHPGIAPESRILFLDTTNMITS